MKPSIFQRSVVLDASIEQVYAFHENPHNITKISPAWLAAEIVQASPIATQNDEFYLRAGLRGIPLRVSWRGFWALADRPRLLADGAKQCPLKYWQHEHKFDSLGPKTTRMTDRVSFLFPGGILGKLFSETLGRLQMHLMFIDRHRRTRRWMRENADTIQVPAASS